MTLPWPATGQPGGGAGHPRSTRPGCGSSTGSTDAARSAGSYSCTPTENPSTLTNGSNGLQPSARRPATTRSPSTRDPEPKADPQCPASPTPPAGAASQAAPAVNQHFRSPDQHAFRACPSRLPGKRAWPVPRGRRRSNAPPLPDWKGPFYRLEAEGFECVLADAKQVRHLPGRPKRDPADSRWLAACFERGAVTPCFVATEEFRVIRLHTRYRRDLTEERTREKQRAE